MVKEIKVGEKTYQFKDRITGLEFVNKMSAKMKEGMMATVRTMADAMIEPKLSAKDIFMLDLADFIQLISRFSDKYGIPTEYDFLEPK